MKAFFLILAALLQNDFESRCKADLEAEVNLACFDSASAGYDDALSAREAVKDALDAFKASYVLVLTEGEETEVDRVSRCPLITFESFVRINDFVE